jgi:hypothetical protein
MKTPLKTTISAEHPLLIIMAPHEHADDYHANARRMVECWEQLDDEIKPYVTVQFEGICDDHFRRNEVLLPIAERAGMPITLQIQTNNADVNDAIPYDRVRRYVDDYSCIVGLQIVESSLRTFVGHGGGPEYTMGRNARYARDIIRTCGQYGLFMSWQQMTENFAAVGSSVDNEALFETVCEFGEYVVPMHEMNCEDSKYIDHLSTMGLWLSGTTAQWGVEAQSWYWSDAGYSDPGCFLPGSLKMPGEVYSIMFLLGASAGAAAYSVEPGTDFWYGGETWIEPTFKRLVRERLIPSRAEVLETTPVAYHMPRCEKPSDFHRISEDLDFDRNGGRLIRATYGVFDRARDAEMIPNTPRYGWIPLLPTQTPKSVLDAFDLVIRPGDLKNIDHARDTMNDHFPPVDRGEAWSVEAGPLAVAANSHENWYVPEIVKISVPKRPTGITLTRGNRGQILTWNRHEGDREYNVWRSRDGSDICLTRQPIAEGRFHIVDGVDGDLYSVSAVTGARESIEGVLHLHEFLVFSRRESRRTEWVGVDGERVERPRLGEMLCPATPDILAKESRSAKCTLIEDLQSPVIDDTDTNAGTMREVMDAMVEWKQAIEAEDIDRILDCYAESYREPDGRTTESVGVVFRSVFRKYMTESTDALMKQWGSAASWSNPAVRLIVRDWTDVTADRVEVAAIAHMWMGGGPEMEPSDMFKHPFGRSKDISMVWTRSSDRWRIEETTPPFLRMEDTGVFRFRYQGW